MSETNHPLRISRSCPTCNWPLAIRKRKADAEEFLSCTNWRSDRDPSENCGFAESYDKPLATLMEMILKLESQVAKLKGESGEFV